MCGSDATAPPKGYHTQPHLEPDGQLVVERFPVTFGGTVYPHGRICYLKGGPPAPVILVHHNYAGLKAFDVDQASFLARCGYVGLAVDLYPEVPSKHDARFTYSYAERSMEGIKADSIYGNEYDQDRHFGGAFERMQALLEDPVAWRALMAANLHQAFEHQAVARSKAGAIGYCLGGQSCLEHLRAGHTIQAIVTFHGLLHSRPMDPNDCFNPRNRISPAEYTRRFGGELAADVPTSGCRVLIENGALDDHVPPESIDDFVREMDRANIDWRLTQHARTPHGFALAPGVIASEYVEAADRRSTLSMLALFQEVWPEHTQHAVKTNASGTTLDGELCSAPPPSPPDDSHAASSPPRSGLAGMSAALLAGAVVVGLALAARKCR